MILALGYWQGDQPQAMRLARFMADLEPKRRTDCALVFSRRQDCELTAEARATMLYCAKKFSIHMLTNQSGSDGWPAGCNGLWQGTIAGCVGMALRGAAPFSAIFTFEPDCVPLSQNWIGRLIEAHRETIKAGKRITGDVRDWPTPHVNGNLIMEASCYLDHPSLEKCPPNVAWDLWHAPVTLGEVRRGCHVIRSEHRAREIGEPQLVAMAHETAVYHGCKDQSAIEAARRMLLGETTREEATA